MSAGCANCHGEGWVCESHTSKGWPSVCDCGAGAPCPMCNPGSPPFARALHALAQIEEFVRGEVPTTSTAYIIHLARCGSRSHGWLTEECEQCSAPPGTACLPATIVDGQGHDCDCPTCVKARATRTPREHTEGER